MLRTEQAALGCEQLAKYSLGFGVMPQGALISRKVMHRDQRGGVLRAQHATADLKYLTIQAFRRVELPAPLLHDCEVAYTKQCVRVIGAQTSTLDLDCCPVVLLRLIIFSLNRLDHCQVGHRANRILMLRPQDATPTIEHLLAQILSFSVLTSAPHHH